MLPVVCFNLRHTRMEPLFTRNDTSETDRLLTENSARVEYSLDMLSKFGETDISPCLRNNTISSTELFGNGLAITIVSVSRVTSVAGQTYYPKYLIQTVAKFLELLNKTSDINVQLSVCNVDQHPERHHDMTSLPKWLPVNQRANTSYDKSLNYNALLDKEKQDYVYCIERLLATNMTYIMLVEDDALPNENLFKVLKNIFRQMKQTNLGSHIGAPRDEFSYIKLYHPERLVGYISLESVRILELISTALVFTMTMLTLERLVLDRYSSNVSNGYSRIYILALFTYFILVALCLDRYNILQLRRISNNLYYLTPAPSCCTPAILFSRKGATTVSSYLRGVTCKKGFAKDTALDKLVLKQKLYPKLVEPNLFKHIGHFSSLRNGFIDPYIM